MFIKELYLRDYNRLSVSGIKSLYYKPQKKMQIILGTNGSGKSSLLKELIPNVDNLKNDYGENGYKKLIVENNGNSYEIIFDNKDNKHKLIKNGEDLNPNGQLKIQKELLDKEFNITKDIHDLLLDKVKFTNMSPSERKKWFLEILSTIDYDYALGVFKKAKDRQKELQSFIKLTRSKLLNEENEIKDLPDNFKDILKSDIDKLNNYVEKLIEMKKPYKQISINEILTNIGNLIESLVIKTDKLEKIKQEKSIDFNSIDSLISSMQTKKEFLIDKKNRLQKELENIDELKLDQNMDIEKLKDEFNKLEQKLKKVANDLELDIELDNLEFIFKTYNFYKDEINETIVNLSEPELKDLDVSETNYIRLKTMLDKVSRELEQLKVENKKLEYKFKHLEELKNSKDIKCPKCGYVWKEGFSDKEYEDVKNKLDKNNELLTKKEKEIEELNNEISKIEYKRQLLKSLYSILKQFNIQNLKDKILDITFIQNLITKFNLLLDDLIIEKSLRYKELKGKIEFLKQFDNKKLQNLVFRLEELKYQLTETVKELNKVNSDLDFYSKLKNYLLKTKEDFKNLERELKNFNKVKVNELNKLMNEFLSEVIYYTKEFISVLEDKLIKITNTENRKKELEKDLESYEIRLKAIKAIIDMLSPNKGIIGISVTNVVNNIIEKMNYIIRQIWTYDMEIIGYEMETNRFPVRIMNSTIPDVSKGSAGMREVFDLAFKIVAMEYLNMLDYPLFLDEFGSNMDETHRIKAFDFIERLTNEYFSQVFLISHFESLYSRFTNADVIILDKENINFNGEYNTVIDFNIKGDEYE